MEISYKKDLEKSYMLIKTEKLDVGDYRIKMLCNNRISGMIPLTLREFNNNIYIYYDISGKISLTGKFTENKIKADDIRKLMYNLQTVIESAKEYMLSIDKIVLDMDLVFISSNKDKIEFCYYPDKTENFTESLHSMLNKIIELADHTDRETVIISYGLQKMTLEENITINEMLAFLGKYNKKESDKASKTNEGVINTFRHIGKEQGNNRCECGNGNIEDGLPFETWVKKRGKGAKMENTTSREGKTIQESKTIKNHAVKDILTTGWIQKIKQTFVRKRNYENIEEMKASEKMDIYMEETDSNLDVSEFFEEKSIDMESYRDIEETVLLKTVFPSKGIILKCSDEERAQTIIPNEYPCIVGKSRRSSDCIIEDKTISRVHMRINEEEDGYYIEDLNSTNGTYLNGEKIKPHQLEKINIGDIIKLAEIEYVVC